MSSSIGRNHAVEGGVFVIGNNELAQLLIGGATLCIAFAALVLKIIEVARKGD